MHRCAGAAAVRRRPREAHLRHPAVHARSCRLDFEDHPFEVHRFDRPCALCGADRRAISTRSSSTTAAAACSSAPTPTTANAPRDGTRRQCRLRRGSEARHDDDASHRCCGPRPRQALRRARRLRRRRLRSVAGRGAGGRRRVGLGQVDAARLLCRPQLAPTPGAVRYRMRDGAVRDLLGHRARRSAAS